MRGKAVALAMVLLVGPLVVVGQAEETRDPTAPCTSPSAQVTMEKLLIESEGTTVHACLATPAAGVATVDQLVVFAHGLGWTVQAGWLEHMAETVERAPGTAVVATNYRDNFGMPIGQGAEDLARATQAAKAELPAIETTYLLGVSLGGAVSGTAIHLAPSLNEGQGLFDHWVDVEGLVNLFESYAEARTVGLGVPFAAEVADAIEEDAGGTPAEVPQAYAHRSPVLNAPAMAEAGLQSVVVVHGVNDGLVPYNQGREMARAAAGAGLATELHTVTRTEPGQTAGTTPTSHALAPQEDPNEQHLHLAGHASEADRDHPVMHVALERLFEMLDGQMVGEHYEEHVVDPGLASLPS